MKASRPLVGIVAAVHTPFRADGSLNLDAVQAQAAHLRVHGIELAFVGGSTGESHSLSLEERRDLARR
jgi:N-acetylneuraminate lyase